ncbi:NAD-dependent epimerase/dehydratase family protein [Streptomyces scabiei]|uniref:NAD-dependent epimerase/dehydratase family protein n=1 Tax=Streptomyces scabiei TaxID=1930 RepID=UPI00068FE26D|nr:NAD-dependent epimerase/dehydratase family protein [Streptomyces scabiei]
MHTPAPATAAAGSTPPPTNTDTGTVLLVGGTGFIGRAVLKALTRHHRAHGTTPSLRVLSRRTPPTPAAQHVTGDLTDPPSLHGICSGITTVIHTASYVGSDPQKCHAINHTGTQALLTEAARHAVTRFIYISTASVYGTGPHRGPHEGQLQPAPLSPASTTRLHAEEAVRAAGGTILRPHLVYGTGDHWFIPTLARVLRHIPTWPDTPPPHTSAIAVQDLARIITALTHQPPPHTHGSTYHVADPRPLPMDHLHTRLRTLLHLPPARHTTITEHRTQVRKHLPQLTDHQYALLTEDHYYDTTRIWHHTQLHPGPGFDTRFTTHTPWYTHHLNHHTPPTPPQTITPPAPARPRTTNPHHPR